MFCDEPIHFRAGSAQIDGGGEGVLPTIAALAARYVQREALGFLEWRIHAVHCANPNLKLRRVLERRGLQIREVEGVECYHRLEPCTGGAALSTRADIERLCCSRSDDPTHQKEPDLRAVSCSHSPRCYV